MAAAAAETQMGDGAPPPGALYSFGTPWPELNQGLTYTDTFRCAGSPPYLLSSAVLYLFWLLASRCGRRYHLDWVLLYQPQELGAIARASAYMLRFIPDLRAQLMVFSCGFNDDGGVLRRWIKRIHNGQVGKNRILVKIYCLLFGAIRTWAMVFRLLLKGVLKRVFRYMSIWKSSILKMSL